MSMGNPTADLLEYRAFPRLADALRERRDRIIRRWERDVRDLLPRRTHAMSRGELRDHLPVMLDAMASALAAVLPSAGGGLMRQSRAHGEHRFEQDYDVRVVLLEYRLLRRIIIEEVSLELADGRMSPEEMVAIDQAVDTALQEGLVSFVEELTDRGRAGRRAGSKCVDFLSEEMVVKLESSLEHLRDLAGRLRDLPEFAADAERLAEVQRAIMQSARGAHRLLRAERVGQGSVKLNRGPVRLRAVAEESLDSLKVEAEASRARVHVDVPQEAVVSSDREIVLVAVEGLLGNALRRGGTGREVTVTARPESNRGAGPDWTVEIADSGPRLPEDDQQRLADALADPSFRKLDDFDQSLSLPVQAVRALGGALDARPNDAGGTTFRFCLPHDVRSERGSSPRAPYV